MLAPGHIHPPLPLSGPFPSQRSLQKARFLNEILTKTFWGSFYRPAIFHRSRYPIQWRASPFFAQKGLLLVFLSSFKYHSSRPIFLNIFVILAAFLSRRSMFFPNKDPYGAERGVDCEGVTGEGWGEGTTNGFTTFGAMQTIFGSVRVHELLRKDRCPMATPRQARPNHTLGPPRRP